MRPLVPNRRNMVYIRPIAFVRERSPPAFWTPVVSAHGPAVRRESGFYQDQATLFTPREFIGISWDAFGGAAGVRLCRERNGRLRLTAWKRIEAGGAGVGAALRELLGALNPARDAPVLAGGAIPGTVVAEFSLPVRRLAPDLLRMAVGNELGRHVPYPARELAWSYRVLSGGAAGDGLRVRVCAVPEAAWNKLLDELAAAGVTADAVVHPFLLADPLLAERDLVFPDLEPESVLEAPGEDGARVLRPRRESDPAAGWTDFPALAGVGEGADAPPCSIFPAALLAVYGLSPEYRHDRAGFVPLPPAFESRQHRGYRRFAVAAGAAAAILFLLLAARVWLDARFRLHSLEKARVEAATLLARAQQDQTRHAPLNSLVQSIAGARAAQPDLPRLLLSLAARVPDSAWLTEFNQVDGRMELTFRVQDDDTPLLDEISRTESFDVERVNKRRGADGSLQVVVSLVLRGAGAADGEP